MKFNMDFEADNAAFLGDHDGALRRQAVIDRLNEAIESLKQGAITGVLQADDGKWVGGWNIEGGK